jgi:O-antigen ligase
MTSTSIRNNKQTTLKHDNFIFYFFLATLVWAPLPLGGNRAWSEMLLCILISCLCLLWSALYLFNKATLTNSFKKALPIILLFFLSQAFLVYQVIYAISIDNYSTQKEFILGINLVFVFALSLVLLNTSKRIKICIYVIVFSGLFQALYGSLMTLTGLEYTFFLKKETYLGVATGTFINRNHLAGYLVICLSLGLGMMVATLNNNADNFKHFLRQVSHAILSKKIILRISLIIMVAALVMTHSRMGNTSFFVSMGVIGTLAILLKKRSVGSTIILLISLIIIDITVVGTFFGVDKVINRLENTSAKKETRDEVNQYSIKIIEKNLYFGTGAGTFYTAFPKVREKDVGFIFYDHAHNDYIQFLSERGLVGFIPLLLAVIITFLVALKALWKRRNPLMRGCAFGCLMSMLAMAIHATVDFNLQIPANAVTFRVVLALGWVGAFYKRRES